MGKKDIEMAEQQFTGYALGISGGRVPELIQSMDLTCEEWTEIKNGSTYISHQIVAEVDEYFKQ